MAMISAADIRFLEDLFSSEKGRGYVLDFSDRTFSQFFRDEVQVNIDDQKYSQDGSSKGKRLRKFLQTEQQLLVARTLRALWNYRNTIKGSLDTKDEIAKQQEERFFQLVHAMDGKGGAVQRDNKAKFSGFITSPRQALTELNDRLLKLVTLKAQERGFAFEAFLSDLFALYELAPRRSFRNTGEQIDGSFELPPETFLLEAKWQDAKIGQADLLTFSGKVEGKAQWTRGLFVSHSGFSDDGLRAFALGRRTSIVCMDGLDLAQVLFGGLNFIEVIQRKKRRAAETGKAFVPVRELFTSVT